MRQNSPVETGDLFNLEDGTDAMVRPIFSADAGALLRFHGGLSARSIHFRYFALGSGRRRSGSLTQVDGKDRVALVVERASERIAVGRYDRLDDQSG